MSNITNKADLGKVAITVASTPWNANTKYEKLTQVFLDGDSYVSLKDNKNVNPSTDTTGTWTKSTAHGKSLYELLNEKGLYDGTEEEFLAEWNKRAEDVDKDLRDFDVLNKEFKKTETIVKNTVDNANTAIHEAGEATNLANSAASNAEDATTRANAAAANAEGIKTSLDNFIAQGGGATDAQVIKNTDDIATLDSNIAELAGDKRNIDMSVMSPYKGVMATNDANYSGADETKYQHKYISVSSGDKFVISSNGVGVSTYAFVKSIGITGETVDLASGESVHALIVGDSKEIIAPTDAVYLCVNTLFGGKDITPIITKEIDGKIPAIEKQIDDLQSKKVLMYGETQSLSDSEKDTALTNIGIDTPTELIDMFKIGGSEVKEVELTSTKTINDTFIPPSGTITPYTGYNIIVYSVEGLNNIILRGTNNLSTEDNPRAYAFYADEECTTKVGDVGERIQPLSYEYNLDVPSGANYIGCCINAGRNPTIKVFKLVSSGGTKMSKLIQDVNELSNATYGLYKNGEDYYHFCQSCDKTIIRKFKREGANNLFQLSQIGIGSVSEDGVNMTQVIQTCGTDNVGPISLYNTSLFSGYGEWTGGYHSKTIGDVAYPTAEQSSLIVSVNGSEVIADGIYYGKVHFKAVNNLYFPQSITGSSLSDATKALIETRDYILDEKMTVKVKMIAEKTIYVSCYYGLQAVTIGFDNIFLPNNGKEFTIATLTENLYLLKPERKIYMNTGNMHYDLTLKDVGCGQFDANAKVFGMFAKGRYKAYFMCIQDANKAKEIDPSQSSKKINEGEMFGWEGVYDIYFD